MLLLLSYLESYCCVGFARCTAAVLSVLLYLIIFFIPSFSSPITAGEIAVQDCALLIAELTAELQLIDTSTSSANKQQSDSEREKEMMYNLIQTCVLLKLLGMLYSEFSFCFPCAENFLKFDHSLPSYDNFFVLFYFNCVHSQAPRRTVVACISRSCTLCWRTAGCLRCR